MMIIDYLAPPAGPSLSASLAKGCMEGPLQCRQDAMVTPASTSPSAMASGEQGVCAVGADQVLAQRCSSFRALLETPRWPEASLTGLEELAAFLRRSCSPWRAVKAGNSLLAGRTSEQVSGHKHHLHYAGTWIADSVQADHMVWTHEDRGRWL